MTSTRRELLRTGWKVGGTFLAVAAGWTAFESLRPLGRGSKGAVLDLGNPANYPTDTATYVTEGRLFVANASGHLLALSQKCPHLGCRVPFCDSSGRFECPCHGSMFDLGGEWIEGPVAARHGPVRPDARERGARRRHVEARRRSRSRGRPVPHARQGPSLPRREPDRAPRTSRPTALRARSARAQPRPLPRVGARLHGRAHRRVRRLPGAGADAAGRRRRGAAGLVREIGHAAVRQQLRVVPRQGRRPAAALRC